TLTCCPPRITVICLSSFCTIEIMNRTHAQTHRHTDTQTNRHKKERHKIPAQKKRTCFFCSSLNWFSFCLSLSAVTMTTTHTATRIATPSIHPVCLSSPSCEKRNEHVFTEMLLTRRP